ncbi:MAG: hypothetical protein KGM43_19100 [Planctomycetota bacterium]|nr:hypothetical protein [Planctomycetota bacterium]
MTATRPPCCAVLCCAMIMPGCGAPLTEPDLAAILGNSDVSDSKSNDFEHDLGPVLASGQTIHHEFTLRNKSDRPLALLKGSSITPSSPP